MFLLYNIILCLFTPFIILFFLRKKQAYENITALSWRLASYNAEFLPPKSKPVRIWVHAASIGEINAIVPLILAMREMFPQAWIGVSTMTASGLKIAQSTLPTVDQHFLIPFDLFFTAKKAMRLIRPSLFITVETELWPNLLKYAHHYHARILMVNGRLSPRSIKSYQKLKPFFHRILSFYDAFSVIHPLDGTRLASLGADPAKILVNGNVKFDRLASGVNPEYKKEALRILNLTGAETLWVAGSTREGEEELLLTAYTEIKKSFPELLLVIAPRHIQRAAEIAAIATSHGYHPVLRTAVTSATAIHSQDIVILDTIGELFKFYSIATVTFCGGSLVPQGGQNPLEPTAWGKMVLYGPSMEDFLDAKRLLEDCGCGIQVRNPEELAMQICHLLKDKTVLEKTGEKGLQTLLSQRGSTERNLQLIREYLPTEPT